MVDFVRENHLGTPRPPKHTHLPPPLQQPHARILTCTHSRTHSCSGMLRQCLAVSRAYARRSRETCRTKQCTAQPLRCAACAFPLAHACRRTAASAVGSAVLCGTRRNSRGRIWYYKVLYGFYTRLAHRVPKSVREPDQERAVPRLDGIRHQTDEGTRRLRVAGCGLRLRLSAKARPRRPRRSRLCSGCMALRSC